MDRSILSSRASSSASIANQTSKWNWTLRRFALPTKNDKLVLYDKFLGKIPPLVLLKSLRPKIWHLPAGCDIIDMAGGFFCFKFHYAEEVNHILLGGPWFLSQLLTLIPGNPAFLFLRKSIPVPPGFNS